MSFCGFKRKLYVKGKKKNNLIYRENLIASKVVGRKQLDIYYFLFVLYDSFLLKMCYVLKGKFMSYFRNLVDQR